MKLKNCNLNCRCWLVVAVLITAIKSFAQPESDMQKYSAKYPGRPFIIDRQNLEAFLFVKDDTLCYRLNDYKSIMVLTDNAGYLAEQKNYFNSRFKIDKMEAWSEVPVKGKYKKHEVTNFTKSAEISDGVFYDDQYCFKCTFPNVAKGVRMVSSSSSVTSEPHLPITFYFGSFSPVEEAVLTVHVPVGVNIRYQLFGLDTNLVQFTLVKKKDMNVYQWKANIPKAYDGGVMAPSIHYCIPHIIVQPSGYNNSKGYKHLMENLDQLYAFNYSNIEKINLVTAPEIARLTDSLTQNIVEPREKVRAIYRWVQQNIKYVAIEDGDNGIIPRPADLVLKRLYGDCKDKTSILVAMMRAAGLKASYVWVGSRDLPYRYTQFPSVMIDNHMIACWWDGDQPVILDGTTHTHKMEDIPAFIQGKECLIEKGKDQYQVYNIPVAMPKANEIYDSAIVTLGNGMLKGKSLATFSGEHKAIVINQFEGHDTNLYTNIVGRLLPKASNKYKVTHVQTSSLNDLEKDFAVKYEFILPDYITSANNEMYINLNITRFLADLNIKPDRWIPIEAEMTMLNKYICVLQLPQGFEATTIPETVNYQNPKFGFKQEYKKLPGAVMLSTEIDINFQIIDGNDMVLFRQMIQQLTKSYLQTITLQKK